MDYEKILIELEVTNDAFSDINKVYEVARIFRLLAENLENGYIPSKIKDINGNTVGKIEYK